MMVGAAGGKRVVKAPTGTTISCRGWLQEAALRMIMNNLDPDVAERPDDLVVYGGSGQGRTELGSASTRSSRRSGTSATTRRSSCSRGSPSPCSRPTVTRRACSSRTRTSCGDWATWDDFRDLEREGPHDVRPDDGRQLDLHRHAGHPPGHVRDLRRARAAALRREPRGQVRADRRHGRHGRRAAAGGHHERRRVPRASRSTRTASSKRIATRLLRHGRRLASTKRSTSCATPSREKRPLSVGLLGNCADVLPGTRAARRQARRRHRPDVRARPAQRATSRPACRSRRRSSFARSDPERYVARSMASMADHVRAMLDFLRARLGRVRLRQQPPRSGARRPASRTPSTIRASCRPIIRPLFCRGKGPFRWVALSGDPRGHQEDRRRSSSGLFPDDARAGPLDPPRAREGRASRGCRPGSAGSATASGRGSGSPSTTRWRPGSFARPIVIGRDHLDSGSVASPYRETESMLDGTDAIADWPILNALVNAVAGATWVSFHHGGGVGIGNSLHAGMVVVADGTPEARRAPRARAHDRSRHGRRAPRRRRVRSRDGVRAEELDQDAHGEVGDGNADARR